MQKSKKSGYNKMKGKESSDSQPPNESNSNKSSPKNKVEDRNPPPDTANAGDESMDNKSSGKMKFQRVSSVSTSGAKRNFSIRRSTSVSERYCRIHDQHLVIASPYLNDDKVEASDNESAKGRTSKKIFKACKRIFRF